MPLFLIISILPVHAVEKSAGNLTVPVILYHFQRLSLISLIANPLVLPAQPPLMVLGGLATLLGLVFIPLGKAAAYLAWPVVAYTIRTVEWMAGWPGAVINLGQVSLLVVLSYYALLFGLTFGRRALGPLSRWPGAIRAGAAGASPPLRICTLPWRSNVAWPGSFAPAAGTVYLTPSSVNDRSRPT